MCNLFIICAENVMYHFLNSGGTKFIISFTISYFNNILDILIANRRNRQILDVRPVIKAVLKSGNNSWGAAQPARVYELCRKPGEE